MANKILTTVYDNHGNEYTTDVYVIHDTNISNMNLAELRIHIILNFYKDQNYYTSGFTAFQAISSLSLDPFSYITSYVKEITPEEAPLLNAVMVQGFVTDYLKGIFGTDNVIEV